MIDETRVYVSDASWSATGNRSGRRFHFCNPNDPALAACGRFVLDNLDGRGEDPSNVEDSLRCQRRACQRRYANVDAGEEDVDHA